MMLWLTEPIRLGPFSLPLWITALFVATGLTFVLLRIVLRRRRRLAAVTTGFVLNGVVVFIAVWKLFPLVASPGMVAKSPLTLVYSPGGLGGTIAGLVGVFVYGTISVARAHHGKRIVAMGTALCVAAFSVLFAGAAAGLSAATVAGGRWIAGRTAEEPAAAGVVRSPTDPGSALSGPRAASNAPVAPAAPIAPDFELSTLAGGTVTLSELRGKTVVINFWATWCPPCRAEIPHLNQFYDRIDPEEVVLLAVNQTVSEQSTDRIRGFVDTMSMKFPVLLDRRNSVFALYGVRGIPTTFIVGPYGTIRARRVGPVTARWLGSALKIVESP